MDEKIRLKKKSSILGVVAAGLFAAAAVAFFLLLKPEAIIPILFSPTPTRVEEGVRAGDARPASDEPGPVEPISVVAENLSVPWEIAFLPDGDMLVTERPGKLSRLGAQPAEIKVAGGLQVGEGGVMGLALHPRFSENKLLYIYYTTKRNADYINRVMRYHYDGDSLNEPEVIIDGIPAAIYHDGGRIAFGPDGKLYLTTGDATREELAQDRSSLAGKTLRLNDDGSIPDDNPFGDAVWSYGHRNSQGMAWDDKGRLWQTEHGRSGAASGYDELNLVEKGKNYGWPVIEGDGKKEGMVSPVIHSGASDTWAPAGAAFLGGSVWFAGLRGASLYQAEIGDDGSVKKLRAHLRKDFGRLRAVVVGPDGKLYVSTSNTDGRGTPRRGDDKILRIDPRMFE